MRVFIVPHWHFDALWQLPFEEYFDITARNLMDVLEFLDVEPEYKFCIDQTVYVEEFLRRYPELGAKLIRAVKEGRIEPACSGYTQPDPNLPSGEFLVRNIAMCQSFVGKLFGVKAKCGWYLDTYGQSAQLPQIFKKSGVDYFTFWRGVPKEPPSEFLWEGIDRTRILTHRMPFGYGAAYLPTGERRYSSFIDSTDTEEAIGFLEGLAERMKAKASTQNLFFPNGEDFTPPQRHMPEVVREWRRRRDDLEVLIATPSQFFRAVETREKQLPVLRGEFNPIFRGTYSTRIKIKQVNRELENLYLTAETFSTIASLFGLPYPERALEKAIKFILLNQFHDAINGEVTDEVYEEMMADYGKVEGICREVLDDALRAIADQIDTGGEGTPIIIFNPLSWARTDVVEVELAFGDARAKGVLIKDPQGRDVPFQLTETGRNPDGTLNKVLLTFEAEDVPALGYKTYFAVPTDGIPKRKFATSIRTEVEGGRYKIENRFYSVTVDPISKVITSIYDKEEGREVLETKEYLGNVLFDEPDHGSVCQVNGDIDGHQTAIPIKDLPDPDVADNTMRCAPHGHINEGGPVRASISTLGNLNKIRFRQNIIIYDKIKRLDFRTDIEFEGEHRRIRVVFPVNLKDGRIYHEIPYGAIERGEGEYPAINWTDVSEEDYGVTLINQGLPGNSVVGNVMLLTLLRSIDAMYLGSPFGQPRLERIGRMYLEEAGRVSHYWPMGQKALEHGRHSFLYALYPHKGTWREAGSYRVALEFNNPLIPLKVTRHEGKLSKEGSFLSVEPENLVVTVVKRSGEDILVRLYEAGGRKTEGRLRFFKPVRAAETDLLEEVQKEIKTEGKETPLQLEPFEIFSIGLTIKEGGKDERRERV
ncbi:MAG TPA: hypothetical protein EYP53_04475 [Candidatus Latescibacteria bacterium]|nr:hypothetical protein [Candidatus Latescibacterota bacterium]